MKPILALLLAFISVGHGLQIGLNQNGIEVGNKWNSKIESSIYTNLYWVRNERLDFYDMDESLGIKILGKITDLYKTEFKVGPSFEVSANQASDKFSSDHYLHWDVGILNYEFEYAFQEKLSATFDGQLGGISFYNKFKFNDYFVFGFRPTIGLRFYL